MHGYGELPKWHESTVKPLTADSLKGGQPLYSGQKTLAPDCSSYRNSTFGASKKRTPLSGLYSGQQPVCPQKTTVCTKINSLRERTESKTSLVPRLSPSSLFYTRVFYLREIIHAKLFTQGRGPGAGRSCTALGVFDHVRTMMTHSMSTVSTYASLERSPD